MINYDYFLYLILEDKYINNVDSKLPINWYLIKDYKFRNKVLIDAIVKNKKIDEDDLIRINKVLRK